MIPGKRPEFSVQHPPSSERFEDARRIEVKPRGAGPRPDKTTEEPAAAPTDLDLETAETVLHFSCPGCLHMLAAPKSSTTMTVKCPTCSAWVMPPQLVNVGLPSAGKTALPPPKKSGINALKH